MKDDAVFTINYRNFADVLYYSVLKSNRGNNLQGGNDEKTLIRKRKRSLMKCWFAGKILSCSLLIHQYTNRPTGGMTIDISNLLMMYPLLFSHQYSPRRTVYHNRIVASIPYWG
jgi:hypothetical protein